jgi:acyl-coenzyme A thioesterase PaaI-like protein
MFPRPEFDLPILGVDMVGTTSGRITAAVLDISPTRPDGRLPPVYEESLQALPPVAFAEPRALPEWADIFSPHCLFVRLENSTEDRHFLDRIEQWMALHDAGTVRSTPRLKPLPRSASLRPPPLAPGRRLKSDEQATISAGNLRLCAAEMSRSTLTLWQQWSPRPLGKWIFSQLVSFRAPYFATIRPQFRVLEPGRSVVAMRKRRGVLNHIGSVHAIAMCNMAELAGGTMTDVTIPTTHRWIPKGMTVEYRKKATTDLVATATPHSTPEWSSEPCPYEVDVDVTDTAGDTVLHAIITMWVSPRRR